MRKTRLILALTLTVTGLALSSCGGSDDDNEAAATTAADTSGGGTGDADLTATVGPGFTININGPGDFRAGEVTIDVRDKSSIHNFHLTGPGVDMKTEVSEEGDTTWTVNFQAGAKYTFVCDPHASEMKGSFTVLG